MKSPTPQVNIGQLGNLLSMQNGLPVGGYLLLCMLAGTLFLCTVFAFLSFRYIPDIINHQIELRNEAIATSFSDMIKKPLLLKNYLQVNREAQATSRLPGVSYAAVVNAKGVVVGGFFSDLSRFDARFSERVKQQGFPVDIFTGNRSTANRMDGNATLNIGGQKIYDKMKAIGDTGSEVHVGIYVSEVEEAIRNALFSPLTISLATLALFLGGGFFLLLNRIITKPLVAMTNLANRISLGETDLKIDSDYAPREMRELAKAFQRMQQSIKYMIGRLER